jgi:ubiquinone/menaquinone biosynthesis C-methylase UbiE
MGYFLHACRLRGYEVEGMDISDDSADYVRSVLQIKVRTGKAETLEYEAGSFDIITMWHSLEHMPAPRVYLCKARKWLKPDGLLVIDVPNHEGTDAKKGWQTWPGWDLPFHLFHFNYATVDRLLENNGFRVIRKKDYLSEYVKQRIERIPLLKPFARPVARLYSGHSYAVVAEKS